MATAKTLLATTRGKETMQHFFESWLDYPRAATLDKQNIATYANVRADMVQETRAFIDDVVVQKRGGLRELLTATTTNPSTALAQYYGFPAPSASYATITRPDGSGYRRPGAGVGDVGARQVQQLVADGARPARLPAPAVRDQAAAPRRRTGHPGAGARPGHDPPRYEMQHGIGGCALCHKRFDPIGFGFEHFDEGGRYRENEGGLPINSASDVPGPNDQPLFQFTDQESLVNGLVQQQIVYQCMSAYLATYAFGTGDACLGAGLTAEPAGGDGRHRRFVRGAGRPAALLDPPGAVAGSGPAAQPLPEPS